MSSNLKGPCTCGHDADLHVYCEVADYCGVEDCTCADFNPVLKQTPARHEWVHVGYDADHDVPFDWCAVCGTVRTNEEYERDRAIYYVVGNPGPVFGRENRPKCVRKYA